MEGVLTLDFTFATGCRSAMLLPPSRLPGPRTCPGPPPERIAEKE